MKTKKVSKILAIALVSLIFFSGIAVAAARTVQYEIEAECRGNVDIETEYSGRRLTGIGPEYALINENLSYSESVGSKEGAISLIRDFYADGRSLEMTTTTSYIENATNSSTNLSSQLVPVGMERNEQASVERTVSQTFPVGDMRRLCPYYTEQSPITFGDETARGFNEQDVKEISITTRTIVDTRTMEIFHGINSTGNGSCFAGMSADVSGEMVDDLTWETGTRMQGDFELEARGVHRGLTVEEQYDLPVRRP